jgi:hypothetical protein
MDSNHDVMGRLQWCSHYFSNSTMQEKDNQQRVAADTKGIIKIRKLKKDRPCNGQKT